MGIQVGCPNIESETNLADGLQVANSGVCQLDDAVILRAASAKSFASQMPVQDGAGEGGKNLCSPSVVPAYGMPLKW